MSRLSRFWRNLTHRERLDRDLDDELRVTFELLVEEKIRAGTSALDARRTARLELGAVESIKDSVRDVRAGAGVATFLQDVRYALRLLRRAPGFAAAAIATLALGIGANTAIFSVLYAALLRPLPYANPHELVAVSVFVPQLRSQYPSLPMRPADFEEFRRTNGVFSGMSAIREWDLNLTGDGEPERLYGARVSANLFAVLGVMPQLGRAFLQEEDTPGRDAVVVISHDLWIRRFGADPAIVNRPLLLDGEPHLVVGVMPPGFLFPTGKQLHTHVELGPRIDVWKPMAFTEDELAPDRLNFSWGAIARLKPAISVPVARANLDAIAQNIGTKLQASVPGLVDIDLRTHVVSFREVFAGAVQQGLVMLMGAVGLLLVIACVNLASLLLARLSSRARELATRSALGAPRARLIRQLITETVVLAALGGAAGFVAASWGTPLLKSLSPADFPRAQFVQLNVPVFLFAVAIVFAVGLAVGLVPALGIVRGDLQAALTDGSRGMSAGPRTGRLRRTLVTGQIVLCTALLVVAVLLVRSFVNLMQVDRGFGVERVLAVNLSLPAERYGGSQTMAFYRELLEAIRGLPGVSSAGAISLLPLTSQSEGNTLGVYLETDTEQRLDRPIPHYRIVTDGYFAAMGIGLVAGRFFEQAEPASVVLVSHELGRRLWPSAAPSEIVGRRLKLGEVTDDPVTIAGVVRDVRAVALERDPTPAVYVPHARNRERAMTIVVRTAQASESAAAAVRAEVRKRDRTVAVPLVRTMSEVMAASVAPRRFQTTMVLLFGTVAFGLAVVGVFGVTNYAVARQSREIGIRLALGAQRSGVLRSVLAQGLRPVALGLLLGVPAAVAAATVLRSFLFGIGPLDPVTLGAVSIALFATATIACYIPARRAAAVDPVVALHAE